MRSNPGYIPTFILQGEEGGPIKKTEKGQAGR